MRYKFTVIRGHEFTEYMLRQESGYTLSDFRNKRLKTDDQGRKYYNIGNHYLIIGNKQNEYKYYVDSPIIKWELLIIPILLLLFLMITCSS